MKDILILLVEDARDLRQIASACLSQSGARVDAVASITDARRRVLKAPPNLLILDPDSQSEDILSFLSELDSLGIDTIMLTDRLDGDSRIDFFERGVLDIVPKPLQPRELFLRVMRFWKPKKIKDNPKLTHASDGMDYFIDIAFPLSGHKPENRSVKFR